VLFQDYEEAREEASSDDSMLSVQATQVEEICREDRSERWNKSTVFTDTQLI
jgi:hypothetical protein